MRRNAFLGYLLIQVIVIVAVTAIFKVIAERQMAAVIAGFLFVIFPVIMMAYEYRRARLLYFYWYICVLQFWIFFALPIFGLRVLNWGIPFDQLSFLGISGNILHQWSSKSYIVMFMATLVGWWKSIKVKRKNRV
ncbi:MAG: hypothetical protein ACXVCY_10355 [Pseudobdellovibrionaceae bacterium]